MKFRKRSGFTLIELLIVIIIILVLAAALVTAIFWVIDKSKINATASLINRLEKGVRDYANYFGNNYPPITSSIGGTTGTMTIGLYSACLYYYLGFQWNVTDGFGQGSVFIGAGKGGTATPINAAVVAGPFVDFKVGDLVIPSGTSSTNVLIKQSSLYSISDAWGQEIYYNNPGVNHITNNTGNHDNSAFVDIWSWGPPSLSGSPNTNPANYISNYK